MHAGDPGADAVPPLVSISYTPGGEHVEHDVLRLGIRRREGQRSNHDDRRAARRGERREVHPLAC